MDQIDRGSGLTWVARLVLESDRPPPPRTVSFGLCRKENNNNAQTGYQQKDELPSHGAYGKSLLGQSFLWKNLRIAEHSHSCKHEVYIQWMQKPFSPPKKSWLKPCRLLVFAGIRTIPGFLRWCANGFRPQYPLGPGCLCEPPCGKSGVASCFRPAKPGYGSKLNHQDMDRRL